MDARLDPGLGDQERHQERERRDEDAVLEVGTPNRPIPAKHTALIRLHYVEGLNKDSCPAIVCCAGQMDFHGAPLSRAWVKLSATVVR